MKRTFGPFEEQAFDDLKHGRRDLAIKSLQTAASITEDGSYRMQLEHLALMLGENHPAVRYQKHDVSLANLLDRMDIWFKREVA